MLTRRSLLQRAAAGLLFALCPWRILPEPLRFKPLDPPEPPTRPEDEALDSYKVETAYSWSTLATLPPPPPENPEYAGREWEDPAVLAWIEAIAPAARSVKTIQNPEGERWRQTRRGAEPWGDWRSLKPATAQQLAHARGKMDRWPCSNAG